MNDFKLDNRLCDNVLLQIFVKKFCHASCMPLVKVWLISYFFLPFNGEKLSIATRTARIFSPDIFLLLAKATCNNN